MGGIWIRIAHARRGDFLRSLFAGGGERRSTDAIAITMNRRLAVWTKAISGFAGLTLHAVANRLTAASKLALVARSSDQLLDGRRFRIRVVVNDCVTSTAILCRRSQDSLALYRAWYAGAERLRRKLQRPAARRAPGGAGVIDGDHEKCPRLATCDHQTVIVSP